MVALQQDHHASSDATLSTTSNSINNDNEEIKQLSGEIEYDKDSSSARTSKVRRCFGNTTCMPPNLLCFKVRLRPFCFLVCIIFNFKLTPILEASHT